MKNSESYLRSSFGYDLFYQVWSNEASNSDKVILITHGMGEHSESYIHFVRAMIDSVHSIYAWDLKGHGKSEGKRGVGSLKHYMEELNMMSRYVKNKNPDKKIYLVGHSMGGLILANLLLLKAPIEPTGVILSSPLMGIRLPVPAVKDMAARALVKFLPNITLFNEIQNTDLTHDAEILESYTKDPLRHDQICPRLYLDFLEAFENLKKKVSSFRFPVLMQLAGDDRVVSLPASESFYENLRVTDKKKIVYDGFYHEVYNEVGRERVYKDLKEWLEAH